VTPANPDPHEDVGPPERQRLRPPKIRPAVHRRFERVRARADRAHAEYLAMLQPRAVERREPGAALREAIGKSSATQSTRRRW